MSEVSMEQYAAMNSTQRGKITKAQLANLLNSQIGQPTMLPEDTLRNIIKDTIDRSIEEKIPNDFIKTIADMKSHFEDKIKTLEDDNRILKKTILEQQKYLEGMRREKTKCNVFVTGIPVSLKVDNEVITDKKEIISQVFKIVNDNISSERYEVTKIFEPLDNRKNHSAKVTFKDFESKKAIMSNCKRLGNLGHTDPLKKIHIKYDDPPLTRRENKRLSDKLRKLRYEAGDDSEDIYKISKGHLLKNGTSIDEFNLNNQIFA